jgi:nitrile hydratase accessory protein
LSTPDPFAPPCWSDGPTFAEPWQAQVLAIASTLAHAGTFTPALWSATLGAALRRREADGAPDTPDTYYAAALAALEALIAERGIGAAVLDTRVEAWRDAYLATPHGRPVELAGR